MKTWKNNSGYLSIFIAGRGKVMLHRYVWEQHNGTIPEKMEIHHIDRNKENNEISNLEIVERKFHKAKHIAERDKEIQNRFLQSFKGRKHSPETLAIMSAKRIQYWKEKKATHT